MTYPVLSYFLDVLHAAKTARQLQYVGLLSGGASNNSVEHDQEAIAIINQQKPTTCLRHIDVPSFCNLRIVQAR